MSVTIDVLTTRWGAGGTDDQEPAVFEGGEHVLGGDCPCGETHPKPTAAMLSLLGAAESAGVIRILDADASQIDRMERAVQSQEDGEAANAKALGDWVEPVSRWEDDGTKTLVAPGYWTGPWQHGNLAQAVLDREHKLAADDARKKRDGKKAGLGEGDRATIEAELAQLRDRLAATEEPT